MTPDRHARIKAIFLEAIKVTPEARDRWLADACADDPSLRQEVEALLSQQTEPAATPQADQETAAESDPTVAVRIGVRVSDSTTATVYVGTDAQERPPGTIIADRYRIVSELGSGGMGVVYRADDMTLDQTVAMKFLPSFVAGNPQWLARFRNEARIARTVTHPNVCRVFDLDKENEAHFITMEFVPGEDLASLLRRIGRLPGEKAVDISRQVCAGLDAAHHAGVLHRDLKPANIMLDADGNARITDFGVAGLMGEIATRDIRTGTPAYMAPEQITGRDVTAQSDIYALGLVLYELFSGCPAFHAESPEEYMRLHETATPRPLSELVKDLPAGVEDIINRCLEKEPARRPRSALHVAAALPGTDVLRLALAAGVTPAPDLIAAAPVRRRATQHVGVLTVAALGLLISVAVLRTVYPIRWDDLGRIPPAALAERARRVLEAAGAAIPNPHEATGYFTTEDAWNPLVYAFGGMEIASGITPTAPREPCFFYRQDDRPIVPRDVENVFWRAGYVTPVDPPTAGAHERVVLFDKYGHLIFMGAQPRLSTEEGTTNPSRLQPAWEKLLRLAGVPEGSSIPRNLSEQGAQPGIQCDHFAVHNVHAPSESETVAAGCVVESQPSFFAAGVPREPIVSESAAGNDTIRRQRNAELVQRTIFLVLLALAVPVGIMRAQVTTVDYQGALRLAFFAVIPGIAMAVLRLGSTASYYEAVDRLSSAAVRAAGVAGLLCLFYVAIDSYARRYCPHLLVTWNRALLGRFSDPDLKYHALVGVCIGCFWALMTAAEQATVKALGWTLGPSYNGERIAEKLHGIGSSLAGYFSAMEQALILGFVFLLLVVVVRTWLTRPSWAIVISALLLALAFFPRGAHPYTAWMAMGLGGAGVCAWIMLRYGLLAIVVAVFVMKLLNTTPLNMHPGVWTFGISMGAILIVLALIAFTAAGARGAPTKRSLQQTAA